MSIIIKGLDMPKGEILKLEIYDDGRIYQDKGAIWGNYPKGSAIQIPTPHGRLIDGDEILDQLMDYMAELMLEDESISKSARLSLIRGVIDMTTTAPTILEAEE